MNSGNHTVEFAKSLSWHLPRQHQSSTGLGFVDLGHGGGCFKLGQRVSHARFGEGVILQAEGEGSQARVQVKFAEAGSKWLIVDAAKRPPPIL